VYQRPVLGQKWAHVKEKGSEAARVESDGWRGGPLARDTCFTPRNELQSEREKRTGVLLGPRGWNAGPEELPTALVQKGHYSVRNNCVFVKATPQIRMLARPFCRRADGVWRWGGVASDSVVFDHWGNYEGRVGSAGRLAVRYEAAGHDALVGKRETLLGPSGIQSGDVVKRPD
jgi:hypothetical protein